MARNAFSTNHTAIREKLSVLSDEDLQQAHDDTWEALFGVDAFDEGVTQDFSLLEEIRIEERATLKIAGELIEERKALTMEQSAQTIEGDDNTLGL